MFTSFAGKKSQVSSFFLLSSEVLEKTRKFLQLRYAAASTVPGTRFILSQILLKCISSNQNDLKINFLHPCGPSNYFYWPSREDICWVPMSHILCKIDPLKLTSTVATMSSASL